jgi:hypothetical protein
MKPQKPRDDVSFHQFIYRTNPDETIDAICAFCYMTAATGLDVIELQARERAHRCPRNRER